LSDPISTMRSLRSQPGLTPGLELTPGLLPLLLTCLVLLWPSVGRAAPPEDDDEDRVETEDHEIEPPAEHGHEPPLTDDHASSEADEAPVDPSADPPEDPDEDGGPRQRRGRPEPEPPEPGTDAVILPGSECDLRNRSDPLFPVVKALSLMRTGQLELLDCRQLISPGQGPRMIEARIRGADQELLLYRLERLAADGFEVFLAPLATHEVLMGARPAVSGGGVLYVDVRKLSLHGTFVEGDDRHRLEMIIGLHEGNFYPFEYAERLREIGYRAEFYPVGPGEVVIEVAPGRSIRRVRIRGHVPLAKRDITRQLSIDAQPGSLARGQCVEPKRLREASPPPICDGRDVACLEWERDEVARLDAFLFENGYFDGRARLALVCGRSSAEADLYIYLDKGKPYKVDRRRVTIVDADAEPNGELGESAGVPLGDRDIRWIRRQYIPRVLGVFRTRVTAEFMEEANAKVTRAYAEPGGGLGRFWRSDSSMPHPEVDVANSYERLNRESQLDSHNIPVEVRVARGPAVQTEFRPAPGSLTRRYRESGLSFSNGQLRSQIQLFNRREPATAAAARRESANIRAFYQSKGYLFARVEGKHHDFKTMDKLRFEIAEGPKVEIAALEINRPARLDEDVARRIERAWNADRKLRKGGKFSESDALTDIQSVIAAYNAEGYLCTNVVIYLAFWPDALVDPPADVPLDERPRVRARLTVQDLLDSGGSAKWIEQFDEGGLARVLTAKSAKIWVRVEVDPGPRLVTTATEQVRFLEQPIPFSRRVDDPLLRESEDPELAAEIVARSPLHRKIDGKVAAVPVTPSLDRDARAAIVAHYRNAGYPVSDAELTWSYTSPGGQTLTATAARNLPDPRFAICTNRQHDKQVEVEPVVNIYEGRSGEFGDILFRGNFKTREWVLRRELEFKTGERYDQHQVDKSAASIEALGVAKSVKITPYPVGCTFDEPGPCQVHQVVAIEEAKDVSVTVDFGFGIATLNPFYVFANPTFPNIGGIGWDLALEGRWGFDLSEVLNATDVCAGQPCYERLGGATLTRPHVLGTQLDLDISGRIQQRATPARGEILSIIGSLRLSRRFREWTFYVGYLFQLANVSKDVAKPLVGADSWINRSGGIVSDLTGLLDTTVVLNRADNPFNPYKGYIATLDIKLASPWLGGHDWWARFDLSWQHFIPLPIPRTQERLNFRYSLRYGHLLPFHGPGFRGRTVETDTVPDVWRYFGGGTADLGIRGILPETMLVDIEEVELPYGGVVYRPRAQGGHIRAIGTVALQVTSVKHLFGGALAHSLFYDFGVLTQFWSKFDFIRDFRHSVGTNFLKLDIGIVTMAIGYAILLPGRYNVGPTDDRNGRFIFDVGVTF
jgi:outer membrane protein assembly factor BamA